MFIRIAASTAILSIAAISLAHAQGVASDKLIESVTVTGAREHLDLDVPAPIASKTFEDLRTQNLVNPEDALRYVPNLTIRKRYIGDRNALIGGRSFSTLQAPRGLVLMDGYLLSNFLGRFDAPRWNMISPEEIDRVDVLYGPYSVLYPGNSIGTTVQVRTRRPEQREISVRTTAFGENFDQYGADEDFSGYQASGFFGDRFDNGAWFSLAANHQDSTGHPMQYFTVSQAASGQFPAVPSTGTPTPVTGVIFDTDPFGRRRAVFGASGGAIDHTIQNQWKLRGGYALTDWLEAEGFVAEWRNDTENENRTFMRDASGEEVWQGRVIADGIVFDVPAAALAPSTRDERHVQWGTTLRTTRDTGWNASAVFSEYRIAEDSTLQANTPDPLAASGGPGTNSERDGTGWHTFEVQGVYTPSDGDWTGGAHTLAFGYHRNDYRLESPIYQTSDWRSRAGDLVQDAHGGSLGSDPWRALRRLGGKRRLPVRRGSADQGVSITHRAQVVAEGVVVVPAGRSLAGAPQRRPRRALSDRRGAVPRRRHLDADRRQRSEPEARDLRFGRPQRRVPAGVRPRARLAVPG
jgi:iron complex outermembrane receptor protein